MRKIWSIAAVALLAACSSDGGSDIVAPSSTAPSTAPPSTIVEDETTVSTVVADDRPEDAPADNALVILGDTLGITGSCAGRNEGGDVEYRYDLTNDGRLLLTIEAGEVISMVYEGFSGRFESTTILDESVGDGFVTGTATATDGSTATHAKFRATIPVRNCADVTASTVVTEDTTSTTEA